MIVNTYRCISIDRYRFKEESYIHGMFVDYSIQKKIHSIESVMAGSRRKKLTGAEGMRCRSFGCRMK